MRRFRRFSRPRRTFRRSGKGVEVSQYADSFLLTGITQNVTQPDTSITSIILQHSDIIRQFPAAGGPENLSNIEITGLKAIQVLGVRAWAHITTSDDGVVDGDTYRLVASHWWVDGGLSGVATDGSLTPAFVPTTFDGLVSEFKGGDTSGLAAGDLESAFPRRVLHRQMTELTTLAGSVEGSRTINAQQWTAGVRLKGFRLGDRDLFCQTFTVRGVNGSLSTFALRFHLHAVIRYRLIF